jgi:ABC-type dipeptide/oligopeptide/nickel transport system, ATPase component
MLLSVKDLCIHFHSHLDKPVKAVKHVNFELNEGEVLAVVGESGSGKSVTALSLTRLLPPAPQCTLSGELHFNGGGNLLTFSERQLQKIRGGGIAYIFQNASTALNPALTIGFQIAEAIRLHAPVSATKAKVFEWLKKVGLDPERHYGAYPFQLSGGMQQRAMIAMALACAPKILVADEPTTALDVTLQNQIIQLLKMLQKSEGVAIIFITHNLSLIKGFADRAMVMYNGEVVEQGTSEQILGTPQHPYTQALIQCIPSLEHAEQRLKTIEDYQIL